MPLWPWFITSFIFLVAAWTWAVIVAPDSLTPGLRKAAYVIAGLYTLLGVASALLASGVFGH